MAEANELVRDFPQKLSPECENLVIGSSIIGKLEIVKFIPIDCAIHAYRGSTTNEKIKVWIKYDQKNPNISDSKRNQQRAQA